MSTIIEYHLVTGAAQLGRYSTFGAAQSARARLAETEEVFADIQRVEIEIEGDEPAAPEPQDFSLGSALPDSAA